MRKPRAALAYGEQVRQRLRIDERRLGFAMLQPVFERGDLRAYALRYNDAAGTTKFFNAYISKFSEKSPVAGVLSADIELTIDGTILTGTDSGGVATAVFAPAQ